MTYKKIQEALRFWQRELSRFNIPSERAGESISPGARTIVSHCRWMADEALSWPVERREKAMRWLCFIQGCAWTQLGYTIEMLKGQNRPDREEPPVAP